MKAIINHTKGSFDNIEEKDIPVPVIGADEILVKIHAAGVNPVDWKTVLNGYFAVPTILGSDIAGTVEKVGDAVRQFKPGDQVIGSLEWAKQGAFAEYTSTKERFLTAKPKNMDLTESAAIPLAALTAWQAIFDHGKLKAGEKIVIHAAAGGVGLFALQLAKWKGAYVIATSSLRNKDFLLSMGVDEVVDYTSEKLSEKIKNVDVVLDTVGTPEVQLESFKALKNGGHYVSITANPREELKKDFDINATRFLFHADAVQLKQIVELIENGTVKVLVEKRFPLANAREALEYVHKGRTRGKVVLEV